ncbi:hypothetical protein [Nocardia mangyaensis]|uniref:hypothetical protein n=1 Tax=Nocardia mangyaensis TaxID=2213200 RepID=UPI0026757C96|nr:hypothetical protein [Nocardia mangyaensis]MDO3651166.1 hypothetical protein [Nocardia mangyaensis]
MSETYTFHINEGYSDSAEVTANHFKEVGSLVIFFATDSSTSPNQVFALPVDKVRSIERKSDTK